MFGTLVNALGIIIASFIGSKIKGGLSRRYTDIIMEAIPLAVLFIGISGTLVNMNKSTEPLLFIISLLLGSLMGEYLDIEKRLNDFSDYIQKFFKNKGEESTFTKGFVSATLIFCVGTMAILGAIDGGLKGDFTILYTKTILDTVTSLILASTFGIGVLFSGFSVLIYQGMITIFAKGLEGYITADMLIEISIVGGILIFSLGINMLNIKKIKTANMLPAIFIPIIYYLPAIQSIISVVKGLF